MASAEQTFTLPFSLEALTSLSPAQKIGAMASVAFGIALLVGAWMWSKSVDYSVLFSNISERDGGQIIVSLQQMNVPYKFSESGGAILVPASQVHDARLKLASQGLPKGGLVGFEVMETQKLGSSQFLEQINYQRALEGELARSIQSLKAVQGARVHLAIPKTTAFLRDEQKPSASVVLNLYPGRALEANQVAGIVHLVSSSVPQLTPASISVIDQTGNLISQTQDPLRDAGLDPTQLKYLRELEMSYIKRIEAILDPVAGAENVRAQVAADVDFSQTEQMAETYKPNPSQEAAIRSQQTAETGSTSPGATGVPGALSNQPPAPATAPITTPAAPGTPGAAGNATASAQPLNSTKNATVNYELDKTVKHTKGGGGVIKRLSVAVVVNNRKVTNKDGKVSSVPFSATERGQIEALVREAMGFNKDRGDSLNVANVSFTVSEKEVVPPLPLWKDPELVSTAREGVKFVLLPLLAFILWRKLVKPMIDDMVAAHAAAKKQREMELVEAAIPKVKEMGRTQRAFEAKLSGARDLAKQEPKVVADVIRDWVAEGDGK
ncbi:MAG: flagellar basal-body MS-ring/collar protein FliF [Proteobacteria bacterium]|nr:flagellar basal-body MS-ring/collar protein FliF [Pseudomonadota bacterium]